MAEIDDGGPAFPCEGGALYPDPGMSLRDWFAGQALTAVLAAVSAGQHKPQRAFGDTLEVAISRDAYEIADAMLIARARPAREAHGGEHG